MFCFCWGVTGMGANSILKMSLYYSVEPKRLSKWNPAITWTYPSKHETLNQCRVDVGPSSTTLVHDAGPTSTQHWFNVSCLLELFVGHPVYSVKRSDVTRWKQGYIRPPPLYFILWNWVTSLGENKVILDHSPILHCISQLGENKGGHGHWVSQNYRKGAFPANTTHWSNVGPMLAGRHRRWAIIGPILVQHWVDVSCTLLQKLLFRISW